MFLLKGCVVPILVAGGFPAGCRFHPKHPAQYLSAFGRFAGRRPKSRKFNTENVLMAQIAARAIYEADFMVRVKEEIRSSSTGRYSKIHRRIQKWLLDAMTADDILNPQQRCDAGNALNWVEDPRFQPKKWFLPDDENFGFVDIPAGPFKMGSDKAKDSQAYKEEFPQHTVFCRRTPLANIRSQWLNTGCLSKIPEQDLDDDWQNITAMTTTPLWDVSWHDAMAYCEWLTGKLNADGVDFVISLPTEAQWEKAARGMMVGFIHGGMIKSIPIKQIMMKLD
jgi:formylglycine-generating enzyme required for sulfatase activity